MASVPDDIRPDYGQESLPLHYSRVRAQSLSLCDTLAPEDFVVQSMADVSPTKWHLAHTSWFFERFVLQEYVPDYVPFHDAYDYLFNSYYYTVGQMHRRPERGLLSRPTVREIMNYRRHVDEGMNRLLAKRGGEGELAFLVTLGLHHEQQHQELILTDIKHVFSCNPMKPALSDELKKPPAAAADGMHWVPGREGQHEIGATGRDFCFDNETPRHTELLHPHELGSRLITNREYREFIEDGGYHHADLWLSDGWSLVHEQGWKRPLYWSRDLESEFTLGGEREIDPDAPVTHVSYYEADAFASWAGARLPTESEWETAAAGAEVKGNLMDSGYWHPVADRGDGEGLHQLFGDVWEWTASPYTAYPGFRPLAGSLGEYNGKFMCNQMVVRGGSCATASDHIRASYRSFFYPDARWQFLGFRLARDAG
ncbi:ergothioneine biosynthesis protein EgtB [Lentisalinibacter salinarum]|uniref:ergothioneine biosynthesis protein EgtB n=1 Tax=Lentisalinibacter salinarum TaxID=2992239 RepID=UPI003868D60D